MKESGPLRAAMIASSLAACVGAATACQSVPLVRSTSPATAVEPPASDVHGLYAPAGRQLSIELDDTLSSGGSISGEPFRATVESTLFDAGGRVLVAPGDRIEGHVVSVRGSPPQIVLDFDTVQTRLGAAPLVAAVVYVEHARTPTARVERGLLSSPPISLPPEGVPVTSPPGEGAVVLPRGTRMRIELTRPLFPPGTLVGR